MKTGVRVTVPVAPGGRPVVGNQEKSMKTEKTSIDRVAGLDMILLDSSTGRLSVVCLGGSIPTALFLITQTCFSSFWSVGCAVI